VPDPNTFVVASRSTLGLHQSSVIVDLHHDIAEDIIARRQKGEEDVLRRIWLPRFRQAGIKIQVFPIFIDSAFLPEGALQRELSMIHYLLDEFERNAEEVQLARCFRDIEEGLASNKLVAVLGLEGAEAIDAELTVLGILHRLGLRVASLTWNRRTIFADGVGECQGKGLTKLGIHLVENMERLGILVDVSHLSEAGFWSLLEVAQRPVIASHSNARAVCDHPRNLTNQQIQAIARRGGVIGILIHPSVIDSMSPTISRVVDHISHIADLVGSDYVAVGSDFVCDLTGLDQTPTKEWLISEAEAFSAIRGLAQTTDLPNLTEELLRYGFRFSEIEKLLGLNALRIFRQVWS
jgi:membrane dipeptidase